MTHLLHLSDALFLRINDLARASTGLHAPAVAYARYGLVVFAALILLGVWRGGQQVVGLGIGDVGARATGTSRLPCGREQEPCSPSRSTSRWPLSWPRPGRTPCTPPH